MEPAPPARLSQLSRGYLICLIGTILWSSTAIFIRYLTENYGMPALVLAFWRDSLVVVILLLVFRLTKPDWLKIDPRHLPFMVAYGFVLSLFNSLWTVSVALNGAAISTVLAYSSAAFTAVLGWRLFGEPLGKFKAFVVSLSILGTALVSGAYDLTAWQLNPLGIAAGLFSGLLFAAYSLLGKSSSRRGILPWTTMLYTFGFAAIFLLAYHLLPGLVPGRAAPASLFWLGDSLPAWGVLFVLALVPTIGGYGLYTVSMTYLPASVANLIATMEPAMTAVQAYLFLGEVLTLPQLAGSILIVAGVVILRLTEQSRAVTIETPAPVQALIDLNDP